ncbi:MAG TPA: cyclase family protein [Methanoculleus sp.]|nr:cyclase family protein [Methanoculleus sp.]
MTYIDITRDLGEHTPMYPGDTPFSMERIDKENYTTHALSLGTHTGTHIDAPAHFIAGGRTVDALALSTLIGNAWVADLSGEGPALLPRHFASCPEGMERVLVKTSFSGQQAFSADYPSLSHDAAEYLASRGILLIGVDTPSVEAFSGDGSLHRFLLGRNIIVIELLDLSAVQEGQYCMIALPLRLAGLDGAPARVVLRAGSGG